MTILTALQSAMVRLVGHRPNTIFGSTNQTEMEIADIANEVARDIMKSHDWQALTNIESVAGDGVQTAFPLPADYDRMALGQSVQDANTWFWNYTAAPDLNTWMTITDGRFLQVEPGWWIVLRDELQFYPAPTSGATARFPYISNLIVRSQPEVNTGIVTPRRQFERDSDEFLLSERLITLGVIWRYREQKGMGYAEDMANYELALSQEQTRDKGSRVIRKGRGFNLSNVGYGWPWSLGH